MGNRERILAVGAILLVLGSLGGCQIVSPGVTYNIGTLEALISATPEDLTNAAVGVIEDMKLTVVSAESTGLDGKVVARTAQKKTIKIDIKRQDNNVCHIAIRVGRLGDQNTSMLILERIKGRL